jgi:hypothetical protein
MGKKIENLNPLFHHSSIPVFQFVCSAVDIFFFISGGRRDFFNFLSNESMEDREKSAIRNLQSAIRPGPTG